MQATLQQGSWQKAWGMLVARAWSDESFKQRLIDDPADVLREEGIEVPDDVELKVVEETDQTRYLVLPSSPAADLEDEELGGTVGFDGFSGLSWGCGGCRSCGGCGRCGCGCDSNS